MHVYLDIFTFENLSTVSVYRKDLLITQSKQVLFNPCIFFSFKNEKRSFFNYLRKMNLIDYCTQTDIQRKLRVFLYLNIYYTSVTQCHLVGSFLTELWREFILLTFCFNSHSFFSTSHWHSIPLVSTSHWHSIPLVSTSHWHLIPLVSTSHWHSIPLVSTSHWHSLPLVSTSHWHSIPLVSTSHWHSVPLVSTSHWHSIPLVSTSHRHSVPLVSTSH